MDFIILYNQTYISFCPFTFIVDYAIFTVITFLTKRIYKQFFYIIMFYITFAGTVAKSDKAKLIWFKSTKS